MALSKNIMTPPIRKKPPAQLVSSHSLPHLPIRAGTYRRSRRQLLFLFHSVSFLSLYLPLMGNVYLLCVSVSHIVGILAVVGKCLGRRRICAVDRFSLLSTGGASFMLLGRGQAYMLYKTEIDKLSHGMDTGFELRIKSMNAIKQSYYESTSIHGNVSVGT